MIQPLPERMKQKAKVFGIGFQKTGTSSLQKALNELGYKTCGTRPDLLLDILSKRFKKVRKCVDQYDAFFDHPWPQLFEFLDQAYPNSRFILSIRDEESWYQSVSNHIGNFVSPIHEWIYGKGKSLVKDHKQNTLAVYRAHHQKVLDYFKDQPERLLILDLGSDLTWETLCPFLNIDIPDKPFPHENKTDTQKKQSQSQRWSKSKYLRKWIKSKWLLWYINQRF